MKFQAPVGATRIFCAGVEINIEPDGAFEAAESNQAALLPHGCHALGTPEALELRPRSDAAIAEIKLPEQSGVARARQSRSRPEKAL